MVAHGAGYFVSSPSGQPTMAVTCSPGDLPIQRKDLLYSPGRVNLNASPSYNPNGNDMPSKYIIITIVMGQDQCDLPIVYHVHEINVFPSFTDTFIHNFYRFFIPILTLIQNSA